VCRHERLTAIRRSVASAASTTHASRVSASTSLSRSGRTELYTTSLSSGWNVRPLPVRETNAGGVVRSRNATSSGWYWPA
jgi:hypothetical protein